MEEPKAVPTEIPIPSGAPNPGGASKASKKPVAPEKSDTEKMFDAINASSRQAQKKSGPSFADFLHEQGRKRLHKASLDLVLRSVVFLAICWLTSAAYGANEISARVASIVYAVLFALWGEELGRWFTFVEIWRN